MAPVGVQWSLRYNTTGSGSERWGFLSALTAVPPMTSKQPQVGGKTQSERNLHLTKTHNELKTQQDAKLKSGQAAV